MNCSPVRFEHALALLLGATLLAGCVGSIDADMPVNKGDAGASTDGGVLAGTHDAGTTVDADAGSAGTDAGSTESDAGATVDAGSGSQEDAGSASDAGSAGRDAGTDGGLAANPPVVDAGTFTPVAVSAAVSKVKNLLVGLAATNDEVAAVSSNPNALRGLIDQWTALPQYNAKLLSFFATEFQQTQVVNTDFNSEGIQDTNSSLILQSFKESFARTVLQLIAEGRPFTETMTTKRFMITPRLANVYAYIDGLRIDDAGNAHSILNAPKQLTLEYSQGPIPLSQSLDSASPNYMVFYDAALAKAYDPLCPTDPVVYTIANAGGTDVGAYLDQVVFQGMSTGVTVRYAAGTVLGSSGGTGGTVAPAAGMASCTPPAPPSFFAGTDLTQWQMVNIRQPVPGEATTMFTDVTNFRAGSDLVLNTPRVGFFTTPAFFAGWQTNASNVARVTLNQTMIVGLGKAISPDNTTSPPSLAALDQTHAAPGSACYACHQSLDPMRQFFRHDYSLSFGPQSNATQMGMTGQFAYYGVSASGNTIFDLGSLLAGHPMFAANWVQKLCTYANSAPCDPTDPEFLRIVAAFQGSNYNWTTLMRELFSSPIVTLLKDSQTTENIGETFPIARKAHLCAAISARMNINDVCGLNVTTSVPSSLRVVQTIATALPSDQYARGEEGAVLANDPSLVLRTGLENLCVAIANTVIDNGSSRYLSSNPTFAIGDFVHTLMGITGDRDTSRIDILTSHFNAAKLGGANASDSLKSTFVLACLSPSVIGLGQ